MEIIPSIIENQYLMDIFCTNCSVFLASNPVTHIRSNLPLWSAVQSERPVFHVPVGYLDHHMQWASYNRLWLTNSMLWNFSPELHWSLYFLITFQVCSFRMHFYGMVWYGMVWFILTQTFGPAGPSHYIVFGPAVPSIYYLQLAQYSMLMTDISSSFKVHPLSLSPHFLYFCVY